ncbi:MAG: ribonuclease BN, partial [Candidatus Methylomirabilales bacterium]
DGQSYLPARDLERIGIKEILDSLRTFGEPQSLPVQGDQVALVDQVVNEIDRAVATSLAGKDLRTLILDQEPRSPTSH